MSPAYEFLAACLRDDRTAALTWMNQKSQDWDSVASAAMDESLLPLLNTRFTQLQLSPRIPPDVADFLSAVEDLNRERNDHILNEVKFAAQLLNEAGIEPILLKGVAYLALGVYPNPATRYLRDVDLLLPEMQLEKALDILVRKGFEPDYSDQFGQFRHHRPPMRRVGSVFIEVHHCLCLSKCGSLLPASELIERSVAYDLDGVRVRVPCPEDLFTHLIMHSQIQHPYNERIWPPLRAMYDLDLLLRRFRDVIEWRSIERRFRAAGQFGLLVLHLCQVNETLGASAPCQFRMNSLTRLRWLRRKLLRRMPMLRYADPIYMFSTVLIRRLRVLGSMFRKPNGLRHLVRQLLTAGVYRRFAADVVEGRGR
jgi:hypothetical protein